MSAREFVSAGIETMPAVPRARCQSVISAIIGAGWGERIIRQNQKHTASEMAEERLVRMMPDLAFKRLAEGRFRAQFDRALAQAEAVLGDGHNGGAADLVLTASTRQGRGVSDCHVLLHIALICGVPILDFAHDSVATLAPGAVLERISDPVFLAGMVESNRQSQGQDVLEIELARASVGLFAAQKRLPYDQAAKRFASAGVLSQESPLFEQAQLISADAELYGRHEPQRLITEIGKLLDGQTVVPNRSQMTPEDAELEMTLSHAAKLSTQIASSGVARASDMAQIILPAEKTGAALLERGDPRPLGAQLIALSAGLSASMSMRGIQPIEIATRRVRPAGMTSEASIAPAAAGKPASVVATDGVADGKAASPMRFSKAMDIARTALKRGIGFSDTTKALVAEGLLDPADPRARLSPDRYLRDGYLTPEHLVRNLADAVEAPVPLELSKQSSQPVLAARITEARRMFADLAAEIDEGGFLTEPQIDRVLEVLEATAVTALGHPASRAFGDTALIRLAGLVESLLKRRVRAA